MLEDINMNSFSYRKFFGGDTLLVIVPHQDDEINTAGATIVGAIEEGIYDKWRLGLRSTITES